MMYIAVCGVNNIELDAIFVISASGFLYFNRFDLKKGGKTFLHSCIILWPEKEFTT